MARDGKRHKTIYADLSSIPGKTATIGQNSTVENLHADIMRMSPASNGCAYIAHGRDRLTSYAEGRALRDEKAKLITWIYEDILCRWGGLTNCYGQ